MTQLLAVAVASCLIGYVWGRRAKLKELHKLQREGLLEIVYRPREKMRDLLLGTEEEKRAAEEEDDDRRRSWARSLRDELKSSEDT